MTANSGSMCSVMGVSCLVAGALARGGLVCFVIPGVAVAGGVLGYLTVRAKDVASARAGRVDDVVGSSVDGEDGLCVLAHLSIASKRERHGLRGE